VTSRKAVCSTPNSDLGLQHLLHRIHSLSPLLQALGSISLPCRLNIDKTAGGRSRSAQTTTLPQQNPAKAVVSKLCGTPNTCRTRNERQPTPNGRPTSSKLYPKTPATIPLQTKLQALYLPPFAQIPVDSQLTIRLLCSNTQAQQLAGNNYSGMYLKNTSPFKSIFLSTKHKNLNILSNKSNPSHAWGTYAPRRAPVFISKTLASHTNYILIIACALRFTNLHIILHKKPLSYYMFVYSKSVCLQLLPRIMTGHTKPNTRHHNTNHSNEIAMEDVTPPSKRTSPNPNKSSHKKSKSNSNIISLYRDPSQMEFWYGFPIMETIAYEAGMPPIPLSTPLEELIATGYVASKAAELCSAIISFPRVQQKLWPSTRPDGIEGQHINITQLPFDLEVNIKSHLSLDYHILLHFEKPINPFSQDQIMKKLLMRFQTMDIQLGDLIGEPIAVLCHGPKNARV
jgi:hypothetical protein